MIDKFKRIATPRALCVARAVITLVFFVVLIYWTVVVLVDGFSNKVEEPCKAPPVPACAEMGSCVYNHSTCEYETIREPSPR